MIRTLIVDDEPLARSRLRSMLQKHGDVEVLAECSNGREAAALAAQEHPDLLLLDIEMPHAGGFETLTHLPPEDTPAVVFITAHDDFALDAFDANAVDYVVKPFAQERFDRTMDRVRRFLGNRSDRPTPLPTARPQRRRDRFAVRVRGQVLFVKTTEIDWIGAEGNYARLYTGAQSYLVRESMQKLEAELDPSLFVRVHRSAIVNIERVKKLIPTADGSYSLVLMSEATIPLGPSYRERLEDLLGQKL